MARNMLAFAGGVSRQGKPLTRNTAVSLRPHKEGRGVAIRALVGTFTDLAKATGLVNGGSVPNSSPAVLNPKDEVLRPWACVSDTSSLLTLAAATAVHLKSNCYFCMICIQGDADPLSLFISSVSCRVSICKPHL